MPQRKTTPRQNIVSTAPAIPYSESKIVLPGDGSSRVSITYPMPPKLNDQINLARSHWSESSKVKTQWTNDIAVYSYGAPHFPGVVWLDFEWRVKRFTSDPDNVSAAAKYIMDGLVDMGIIVGDSLKVVQSPVVHRFSKGADEVVVTISDRPIYELVPIAYGEVAA